MLSVEVPESFAAENAYVIDVLLRRILGFEHAVRVVPGDAVRINLADAEPARSLTLPAGLLAAPDGGLDALVARGPLDPPATLDPRELPFDAPTLREPLPVLYRSPRASGRLVEEGEAGLTIAADLLGGAFFQLTGLEELQSDRRDVHGRFPSAASLAVRHGFLGRAVVNESAELLGAALTHLFPRLTAAPPAYSVLATHDVDNMLTFAGQPVGMFLHALAADVLRYRNAGWAAARLAGRRSVTVDPGIRALMEADEAFGLAGHFFFMAQAPGEPDYRYDIGSAGARACVAGVVEGGHRAGLHASYPSFHDAPRLATEAARLREALDGAGQIATSGFGGRQHYLRWDPRVTPGALEAAGLTFDSTLGFPDAPGFRTSCCTPFPLWSFAERRPLRLIEHPLAVMDGTLLSSPSMTHDEALLAATGLADVCRRHRGEFVVLWHNDAPRTRGYMGFYRRLLAHATGPA